MVKKLRVKLDKATAKQRLDEIDAVLRELQQLEPQAPGWPHKRGDVLRRMGRRGDAIACFERAVELYAQQGFTARAVAMAKTVLSLDPARRDILDKAQLRGGRYACSDFPTSLPAGASSSAPAEAARENEEVVELDVDDIEFEDDAVATASR